MGKIVRLTESDLNRIVRRVINESSDSGCLMRAGFTRESIGGPMTRQVILQKEKNGVTYQIGLDGNNNPYNGVKVISRNDIQSCTWSCDSNSPIGIKLSGCKKQNFMPV
jgi:hypothetical protein